MILIVGATLRGMPAWFLIEKYYKNQEKLELVSSEERKPVVYNQRQLKTLIAELEKTVQE